MDDAAPVVPPFGAAVRRSGGDVTIAAASRMVLVALAAAETLAAEHGVEADVVDLRALRPLDDATLLASVARTGRAVLVEEGQPAGGVTATLAAAIAVGAPGTAVARVTGADAFVPYAAPLEHAALPDAGAVVRAALALRPSVTARPPAQAAPAHTLSAEIDMTSLIALRRATDTPLAQLVATACAPAIAPLGPAAIVTADGSVATLGATRDATPRTPTTTITLGPTTTRPHAHAGAVTIHHLASLTLRLTPATLTTPDATTLLAALQTRLEHAAD
jgi:hypothetical protein